jgi:HlyD family secretion protein
VSAPSRRRAAVAAVLLVAGLLGALILVRRTLAARAGRAAAGVPTVVASEAPFRRVVTAEGILKPVQTTVLTAPRGGRGGFFIEWLAEDGASVKKGDVLIRFDPTEAKRELTEGEEDELAAEHRMTKERRQIENALAERDRTAALTKEEMANAQALGRKDPRFFPRNEVIESEIDETLYATRIAGTEAARKIEDRLGRTRVDVLAVGKKKARLEREEALEAIRSLEVRAPHDGTFVIQRWNNRLIQTGDRAFSGMRVAEVATSHRMDAEIFVLEADAGGLARSQRAEVVLEARPDLVLRGKIKRVEPFPKPLRPDVPVQYFGALVALEGDTAGWKPGQRLRATLLLDDLPRAIALPRQAIFRRGDDTVVYRRRSDGGFDPVKVKLGPGTVGRLVVSAGVAPGDLLALRDPTRSADETVGDPGGQARAGASGAGSAPVPAEEAPQAAPPERPRRRNR